MKNQKSPTKPLWIVTIILVVIVLYLGWMSFTTFYNAQDLGQRVDELEMQVQDLQVEMVRRGMDQLGNGGMVFPADVVKDMEIASNSGEMGPEIKTLPMSVPTMGQAESQGGPIQDNLGGQTQPAVPATGTR